MLRNIEKITIDNEVILSVTTDTDFEYTYKAQDICRINSNSARIIIGRLINIGNDHIEILVENIGIVKLAHSSIEEIEEYSDFNSKKACNTAV